MHAACSSIIAAWIFIQAASGWCCHPPFWRAPAYEGSAVATARIEADCCKRCGSQTHDENDQSAPCRHSSVPCDGDACYGVCVYLPAQQVQFDFTKAALHFDIVANLIAPTDPDLGTRLAWLRKYDSRRFEPAERLHLLHQIFRI